MNTKLFSPARKSYPRFDFEKWCFPTVEESDMPDPWDPVSDEWAEP